MSIENNQNPRVHSGGINITLLGKRLLVREIPTDKVTPSGIHLPDNIVLDRPKLYRVLQLGTKPVEAKVGDRVLCQHHHEGPVKLEDGTAIITEDQILLILPNTKD